MNGCSRWQWIDRVGLRRAVRSAAAWACFGGTLGLATIVLGACKFVDTESLIALAVPAIVISIGGLINMLIPDVGTAWRRGFEQGCRAGAMAQRDGLDPGGTVTVGPANPIAPKPRTPGPLSQHGYPPAAL